MDEQMNLFKHGGLMQEGGMMDKASGNEVPVGSTRKEVRDDVPAMLSEGEFVFPADVVRYIGLEKLMDLRQHAKAGLAHMEDIGQMGNADEAEEDLPFGMDDIIITVDKGEPVEMAEGGYLPSFMTSRKGDTPIGAPSADDASFVPTLTYETYMNAKGQSTIIPHFDGKPIYAPPAGYSLVSGTGESTGSTTGYTGNAGTDNIEATQPATGGGGVGNRAEAMLANMPQREAIDYTTLTDEELADALSKNRTAAGIATGLSFVAGPVGLLMKFATGMEKRNILKEYERRGLEAPEVTEGFLSNLFNSVKNLFGFGDKEEVAAAPTPTRTTSGGGTGGGATPPAEIDTATATKGINLAGAPTTQRFSDTQLSFGADDTSSTIGTEFGPIGSTQALYDAMVNDVMGDVMARDSRVPEPILPPKPVTTTNRNIVDQPPIPMQGTPTYRNVVDQPPIPMQGTPTYRNIVDQPPIPMSEYSIPQDGGPRRGGTRGLGGINQPVETISFTDRPDIPKSSFDKPATTTTERSSSAPNAAQARLEALRAKQDAANKAKADEIRASIPKPNYSTSNAQRMAETKRLEDLANAVEKYGYNTGGRAKGGLVAPRKKK